MSDKVEYKTEIDSKVYREYLRPWLPPEIIDCHVHVFREQDFGEVSEERRKVLWPIDVGCCQSWGDLRANYARLFPEQRVSALAFGGVYREADVESGNKYILDGMTDPRNNASGLLVTRPEWSPEKLEIALLAGFIGFKPYPDLAVRDDSEVSIYEFMPKSHLRVADQYEAVVMLHLPRRGRLSDPNNIAEILEIREDYPNLRLIVAHIGRAYCLPTAQRGLPYFASLDGVYFDTSANLNVDVLHYAIETIGPDRLLYGTDMPVTLMRGIREYIGETYVNYTNGSYLWNTNRKSPDIEAKYTCFVYEGLKALIAAAERAGCGKAEFNKIMCGNAKKLLRMPVGGLIDKQVTLQS